MTPSGGDSTTEAAEILSVNHRREPASLLLFGKYEIGKLVGRGAFAKVYHARNARTGQSVAIKAINKQRLEDAGELVEHVKREISIMRRLRHPRIVRLFEVLATKNKVCIVMEFAKGGELFARVFKGRFSEDLSRRYFQQLISAVGYCHLRGVFHRDLKPENLLLDEKLDLKITDFGLSAVEDQFEQDGLLHTLCGTPAYAAPEVLANNGYDGFGVDIWSCGVILFVLNSGHLPFNDPNLMVMYRKIYKGEFRIPKWTSPELRRLLNRLLDTNPKTRITIEEIIRDPWFKKGYNNDMIKSHNDDLELKLPGSDDEQNITPMNAFDIISLSPGFDLSGLFNDSTVTSDQIKRFVSSETPARILEKVEEVAAEENLTVKKKEVWGVKIEGHKGKFIMVIEIHRLTDALVMVEVKTQQRNGGCGGDIWRDTFGPRLTGLIHEPIEPV